MNSINAIRLCKRSLALTLLFALLALALPLEPVRAGPPAPRCLPTAQYHYFAETGYCIDNVANDAIWRYFQSHGGARVFGYPVSFSFMLDGYQMQLFQRAGLQVWPDGSVNPLNLLDPALMPVASINYSTFPAFDATVAANAPAPNTPDYGQAVMRYLQAAVPDTWQDQPVHFLQTYLQAAPDAAGALRPLLALEVWGFPTSQPARDPHNPNFIYQRFQRGILHYDITSSTPITRGILIGDAFKQVLTGQGPADLMQQMQGSRYFRQYCEGAYPGALCRPAELPATSLSGAFREPASPQLQFTGISFPDALHGWIATGTTLLATADGGTHWSRVSEMPSPIFRLDFISDQYGWATTDKGLHVTHDGGRTWQVVEIPGVTGVGQIDFVDALNGWITAVRAGKVELLHTIDGGKSWQAVTYQCPDPNTSGGGTYSFINATTGWALCFYQPGVGMQRKQLYKTLDVGLTWQLVADSGFSGQPQIPPGPNGLPVGGYATGLLFLDEQHGWLSEFRDGGLFATTDGGRTWRALPVSPVSGGDELYITLPPVFTPNGVGYHIFRGASSFSNHEILLKTTNGGSTWSPIYPLPFYP